jgi:UDP-N-acetylglucosamine 2-epimerase (non-hydrolysing)
MMYMSTEKKLNIKSILVVFGTRPEAIKMAPLVNRLKELPDIFQTHVLVTGQHREMLDSILALFDIQPDYDLDIMKTGQDLYDITTNVLVGMRHVFKQLAPDLVLVHGDTSTSMAAALAAFYQQIPVGHVEAGLRTHHLYNPFPEEINRQLIDRIATWHFVPTEKARENLLKENICSGHVFVTGNTVIDSLHWCLDKIKRDETIRQKIREILIENGLPASLFALWQYEKRRLILITGHRRENFGEGMKHVCEALILLAKQYPDCDFIYPVHLNPNVQQPVKEIVAKEDLSNVWLLSPLDYLPFIYLMDLSTLVLTDSGGIQEEAPGLGKPVLVMRETTERPEAIEAGTALLVGTSTKTIVEETATLLSDKEKYNRMANAVNPYGDGTACEKIVNAINSKQ